MITDSRQIIMFKMRAGWYLLACLLFCALSYAYLVSVMHYKISKIIQVNQATTSAILSATGEFQSMRNPLKSDPFVDKVVKLLNSSEFFEYLSKSADIDSRLRKQIFGEEIIDEASVTEKLASLISVRDTDDSTILIEVQSREVKGIRPFASKTLEAAIRFVTQNELSETEQAIGFLEEQNVELTKRSLKTLEEIVASSRRYANKGSFDISNPSLAEIYSSTSIELESTSIELGALEDEIRYLTEKIEGYLSGPYSKDDEVVRKKILEVSRDQELKLAGGDLSPKTSGNTREFDADKIEAPLAQLFKMLESKKSLLLSIRTKHNQLKTRVGELQRVLPDWKKLNLETDLLQKTYLAELDQAKEVKKNLLNLGLKRISVLNKLQPLELISNQIISRTPSLKKMLLLAAFLSAILVYLTFVVLDGLSPKIVVKSDLSQVTQHSVLSIPFRPSENYILRFTHFGRAKFRESMSAHRIAMRHLVNLVEKSCNQFAANQTRIVAFQSSQSGEGKSQTAGDLAFAMSRIGKKICLIDADYLKQSLSDRLNDAAAGSEKISSNDTEKPFAFINAQSLGSNDHPQHVTRIVGLLSDDAYVQQFDYVIVDLPPYWVSPESIAVLEKSSAIVLVFRSGRTRQRLAHSLVRELAEQLPSSPKAMVHVLVCDPESETRVYGYEYLTGRRRISGANSHGSSHRKAV